MANSRAINVLDLILMNEVSMLLFVAVIQFTNGSTRSGSSSGCSGSSGSRSISLYTSGSSSGSCTIPRPLRGSSSVPPGKPPQGIDVMA